MGRYWFKDAVFYHIYTFSLAQAPFLNDYEEQEYRLWEIEKWIPHIKGMGFDAVLLSPVLKSRSHGYDVTDYFQIDNRIGTNEEFRSLVDRLHENGMRVVLDSVFNHCGRDFFAFRELCEGNHGYADWFSGVDFNQQSPMGDPFTYDSWSGHYELVKFNLRSEGATAYLLDAARFWMDSYDIDGMRLDSANVMDFDFMRRLRSVTSEKKPDFWLMGEVVAGEYERWVAPGLLDSVTNYKLYKALFSSHNEDNLFELADCLKRIEPDSGLPLNTFLDNHDQPRIASNVTNPEHLFTLYALLFTVPGAPAVYYGSEWGMQGVKDGGSDQPMRPYIDIENPPADEMGLAGHINKLMEIRRSNEALKYGSYREVYIKYHEPFAFERSYGEERILVIINISDDEETVDFGWYTGGGLTDLMSGEDVEPEKIHLLPHSARILKNI